MQVSVAGEVNLFRLSREAYQKAAAMYPHEADKIVKILADRLREEAEKNAKQSAHGAGQQSARGKESARGQRSAREGSVRADSEDGSQAGAKIPREVIESLEARFMDNVIHLCFAAAFGRLHSVKMAFHRGQPLTAPDYDGRTMLHVAVCNNHLPVVQYALQHGADVHAEDRYGNTAFDDAIREGHLEIAEYLLANGSRNLERTDAEKLCYFAKGNKVEQIRLYSRMGADVEKKTDHGRSALHVAAAEGHEELVTFLLDTVHDQAPLDGEGRTPLLDGLEGQHENVINILVNSRNGCKLTVPDGPRKMNTFAAAGEDKALRLYFKCGISVLCMDALGRSPLHVASSAGRKNAVEFLLEQVSGVKQPISEV
jgi:ankyrin repeat protein